MKIGIVTSGESRNSLGEYEFPAVPRVGDHIVLGEMEPRPVEAVHFRVPRSPDAAVQIEIVVRNKR